MRNALPNLTAGVLYLGMYPTHRFNEPRVSQGARSSALAKPPSPSPLSFLIPRVFWDSPYPGSPLPLCSQGSSGARGWGCCMSGELLFRNLVLSSSCWQAAGEERKVNEAL